MRKTIALLAAGVLVLTTLVPATATAKHGTSDEKTYTGPAPLLYQEDFPPEDETTGLDVDKNVGGAGFHPGDADQTQVEIQDESGLATSGLVQVLDANGNLTASDAFCGQSEVLAVPGPDALVNVFVGPVGGVVGAPVFAGEFPPPACAGPGTAGTLTASWS